MYEKYIFFKLSKKIYYNSRKTRRIWGYSNLYPHLSCFLLTQHKGNFILDKCSQVHRLPFPFAARRHAKFWQILSTALARFIKKKFLLLNWEVIYSFPLPYPYSLISPSSYPYLARRHIGGMYLVRETDDTITLVPLHSWDTCSTLKSKLGGL